MVLLSFPVVDVENLKQECREEERIKDQERDRVIMNPCACREGMSFIPSCVNVTCLQAVSEYPD